MPCQRVSKKKTSLICGDDKVENVQLFHGDCLEVMRNYIDNESVDLIITSPPYNLGGKFHTGNVRWKAYHEYNDNMPEELYQRWQIEFLNECYKKLKNDGSMFYNHKPRIRDGVCIHPLEWILKSDFILKQEIVWKNRSQNFDKIRFYPFTERIYWLVKNPKTKLYNVHGLSDVWTDIKNKKRHEIHKATFPVELPQTIIECFDGAKTVLDPFMGIGTTGIACKNTNRNFIGIELDEKYFNYAKKDIENYEVIK